MARNDSPSQASNRGSLVVLDQSAASSSPDRITGPTKMAETGLYEDGKKSVRRAGDPDQRIKDMDVTASTRRSS